ncbi:CPBP family intramembrane glutamic endopeptidase [Lapidilactobacillus wuchangensis]|uniref:CPBP family intramembrane glutamic endopeptidase n=1 Tax=Lapidilactobacillus wuchangensis TaxID=2486001 RepID=UPI000F777EB0|nr:CPBP family intramembrane glutamic endopeptidase [Lapidilactobacillus wuchangensis]
MLKKYQEKFIYLLFGLIALLPLIILAQLPVLTGAFNTKLFDNWLILIGTSITSILLLSLWFRKLSNHPIVAFTHFKKRLIVAILWCLFSLVIAFIFQNVFRGSHLIDDVDHDQILKLLKGPLKVPMIIQVSFIAPICEEISFRGIMQTYLEKLFGFKIAMMLTSLIFALLHGSSLQQIPIFIFSLGLIYMDHRFADLTTSMMTHCLYNSVVTFLNLIA